MIFLFTYGLYQTLNKKSSNIKNYSTKVSIIIPVRNEASTIIQCLNDMLCQDYPDQLFEVIVSDDFSEDHTPEFVQKFIKQHPEFKF